jgi:hypothetical protein
MRVRTAADIPGELHDKLRRRAEQTGTSIRSLVIGAIGQVYRDPKKGAYLTGPLVKATGELGFACPIDENRRSPMPAMCTTPGRDWLNRVPRHSKLAFAWYRRIGLLRLLSNQSVMGQQALTLQKAWSVYDRWLEDPRVEFMRNRANSTGRSATRQFRSPERPLVDRRLLSAG